MRILFASSSSGSRGGGELFLFYLAEALTKRGHQVALWASAHKRMDELATMFSGIGFVQRSPYRNTYDHPTRLLATHFNFKTSRRAANQWKEWNPDLVHINKQNLEDGLDLLRASNNAGLVTLCTIHITQDARFLRARAPGLRNFVSKRALTSYRGFFVAVNESRQTELVRFLNGDESRIFSVPNGVQVPSSAELEAQRGAKRVELGLQDNQKLVIGLGRMVPQKRPWAFLALAENLHIHVPSAQFLWVGDGAWSAEWDRIVAEKKLDTFVRRVPWQTEPSPFLAAGDLFLHTAEFEGLPFALLEAMATGLPCAIPIELAKELKIEDSESFVPVENILEVARTLSDDKRLRFLAQNSISLATRRFSVGRMAKEYEDLYLKTLALNLAH